MTLFERIEGFIRKHAIAILVLCLILGGVLGMLDQRAHDRQQAYLHGITDKEGNEPPVALQLRHICSQPWSDTPGSTQARARVCREEQ